MCIVSEWWKRMLCCVIQDGRGSHTLLSSLDIRILEMLGFLLTRISVQMVGLGTV